MVNIEKKVRGINASCRRDSAKKKGYKTSIPWPEG